MLQFYYKRNGRFCNIQQKGGDMDSQIKILLLTHGGWGKALLKGASMILGKIDFVDEVALLPEMTLPEYMEKVKNVVEKMPEDSLILTDIFGGTTTNVAAKLGRDYNIKVYSGLCAPMLIEACSGLAFAGKIDQSAVLEAGQGTVRDVVDEVLKSLNKEN